MKLVYRSGVYWKDIVNIGSREFMFVIPDFYWLSNWIEYKRPYFQGMRFGLVMKI